MYRIIIISHKSSELKYWCAFVDVPMLVVNNENTRSIKNRVRYPENGCTIKIRIDRNHHIQPSQYQIHGYCMNQD